MELFFSIAAAVSSQEDSIPNIIVSFWLTIRIIATRMAKLLKIFGRTLGIIFEWLLVFLIFFAFAVRTSPVQTYLAQQATAYLSKELNTTVKIDKVAVVFFDQVALDGLLILDQEKDTLLAAKTLFVTLDDYALSKLKFTIGKVRLDDAYGHLKRDKNGVSNLQFIIDYFKSDKPPSGKQVSLELHTVLLNNSKFKYDDAAKIPKAFGFDFAHLDVSKINGEFEEISIVGAKVKAKVTQFSAIEKSGLILKDLTTYANVGKNGIFLAKTNIKVNESRINAPKFNLIYSGFDDFFHFVDSVKFDGKLDESLISLKDVSRFAPMLQGMDEVVRMKGEVYNVVNQLRIRNLDLRVKNKTRLMGSLNLPNFSKLEQSFLQENFSYVYVDLNEIQQIRLPRSSKTSYLQLDAYTQRLGYLEADHLKLTGNRNQFVVGADIVRTQLGNARLDNGILFNQKASSLAFTHSKGSDYDFKVEQFDLGTFLQNKDLGIVDGTFFVGGEAFSTSNIDFNKIEGKVERFDFLGYSYSEIDINEGAFKDKRFTGDIKVNDKYLDLAYNGFIDFNGVYTFDFTADIAKAALNKLNLTTEDTELEADFTVKMNGTSARNISGTITSDTVHYHENEKDFSIENLKIIIDRGNIANGKEYDEFTLNSNVADVFLVGNVDFNNLVSNLDYQLSRILPALFKHDVINDERHTHDNFDFKLTVKKSADFLEIFAPELFISKGTVLTGKYHGEQSNFVLDLLSDSLNFKNYAFSKINLHQVLDSNSVSAEYSVANFAFTDSLKFKDLVFKTAGGNDELISDLTWDVGTPYASHIGWLTSVEDLAHFKLVLEPSFFSLNNHRWEIANESTIKIDKDTISVTELKIEQGKQFVSLNGKLSNLDKHKLNYIINDIELSQLDAFIEGETSFTGRLNSWGYVANPTDNLTFIGDAHIQDLFISGTEIGDIFTHAAWDKPTESVQVNGDLMYKGLRTFDFEGSYFTAKEKDNLAFNLVFENTDIRFTNAFMDPDVVEDIEGFLNGKLAIGGTPEQPELKGTIRLDKAKANVKLLGAHFGIEGPIKVDKYGFYIDGIPVFDEEGHAGSLVGSVYHENFTDFNFDLLFDLETEGIGSNPAKPWIRKPLDKFLVMNSEYSPEAIYYGKAYATGIANIFGYTDNLEITVDLKTRRGTDIKFPMYGAGEIDEEYDFISFKQDSEDQQGKEERKIDFTGVDLDLHFDVTQNADLQIIFNEDLGDIISAKGDGDITIKLDNLGDIRMDGTYIISQGVYDFTMGVIKQPFIIEKGGSIMWTGNPYNAQLDLKTYKTVSANIAALSADQLSGSSNAHEDIRCYLILTETLLKPAISFDITAPKASDAGKTLIDRVRKDKDELNRQFFSLMLAKTFQPLGGQNSASGGAAMDLLENQINGMLAKVSSDYQLNLNLDNDNLTGDNTVEVGLKKGFLDDRLILSGSFGVESGSENNDNGSIIGDVHLEYRLNESGTFRVNVFNESNSKTVIQDQQKGNFTQGAGLHYQEDFNGTDDFKALQAFLDIFRKKGNKHKKEKRKKRQVALPPKDGEIAPQGDD